VGPQTYEEVVVRDVASAESQSVARSLCITDELKAVGVATVVAVLCLEYVRDHRASHCLVDHPQGQPGPCICASVDRVRVRVVRLGTVGESLRYPERCSACREFRTCGAWRWAHGCKVCSHKPLPLCLLCGLAHDAVCVAEMLAFQYERKRRAAERDQADWTYWERTRMRMENTNRRLAEHRAWANQKLELAEWALPSHQLVHRHRHRPRAY
jgi:hypothetical protein